MTIIKLITIIVNCSIIIALGLILLKNHERISAKVNIHSISK
jgi:hypothetical protein